MIEEELVTKEELEMLMPGEKFNKEKVKKIESLYLLHCKLMDIFKGESNETVFISLATIISTAIIHSEIHEDKMELSKQIKEELWNLVDENLMDFFSKE